MSWRTPKKGKDATTSPIGPQTDLSLVGTHSTMSPERPWATLPTYNRNVALLNYKAFHYGEDEWLPGRAYPTYQPMYRRTASDTIGVVPPIGA
jgi:hypothetical protein